MKTRESIFNFFTDETTRLMESCNPIMHASKLYLGCDSEPQTQYQEVLFPILEGK